MPTIGASLRKWTAFLLLCSTLTTAPAQATNSNVTANTDATATSGVAQHGASTVSSQPKPFTRSYVDVNSTCPYRTINYITHTLPQQCLTTSWSASTATVSTNETLSATESISTSRVSASVTREGVDSRTDGGGGPPTPTAASPVEGTSSDEGATGSDTAGTEPELELETDSPFDNDNFLSFEEWKKRNLAQAGQSPENVGQGRAASGEQGTRRRPVNVNALDSLGEEAEIDIDFGGFGDPSEDSSVGNDIASRGQGTEAAKPSGGADTSGSGSWELSKDAGKTCKERFNYASFDCAATVLKTNKKAKGSSAVLSEHKDSYMLNECSVDNKFIIVELCDDILVDTVVLANYEFFSSMFRHFRVSVSDRYPVKMEKWRTLATFEARNSRDIQPFLVTEPQIWARYLRVEFLTHYGNEFYCPLSLLRVHGTTMMEQFRREEEEARGGDDDVESIEEEEDVVKPAHGSGPIPADQVPIVPVKEESKVSSETVSMESASQPVVSASTPLPPNQGSSQLTASAATSHPVQVPLSSPTTQSIDPSMSKDTVNNSSNQSFSPAPSAQDTGNASSANNRERRTSSIVVASQQPQAHTSQGSTPASSTTAPGASAMRTESPSRSPGPDVVSSPTNNASAKPSTNTTMVGPSTRSQSRSSPTQPNGAAPSTQESFFKSIHKRLQYLEANSTLSLQYIEEQSRILRDAFIKVEKKQLAKTEKFLEYMNTTVIAELKHYRNLYEQLWQSTVIEVEGIKERQKHDMDEIGARLSLMADELVWQKRMAVVQSTLLLLCLGLVLFARSGTMSAAADMPIVQQIGTKYSSFFDSPPQRRPETGVDRRRRTFKNMWRSDTSAGLSDRSGHESQGRNIASDMDSDDARSPVQIQYSPPTPNTPGGRSDTSRLGYSPPEVNGNTDGDSDAGLASPRQVPDMSPEDRAKRIQVLATQSGPATPNGTRDSRPSWEEVDRAIDQLKAEEQEAVPKKENRTKSKARSPLRRAQSSYDDAAEENSPIDSASDLFLSS